MRFVVLALATLALAGCQSSQDKSAALEAKAQDAVQEEGLEIGEASRDVQVVSRDVVSDENGTAVAVVLRNTSDQPQAQVPIAIDVRDRAGMSIFRNDGAGADESLVAVPFLPPGDETLWVHDLVTATDAASVEVTVGQAPPASGTAPALRVAKGEFEADPSSGTALLSDVTNTTSVEQRRVTVFAAAREGGVLRAAGRAVVPRVAPGRNAKFSVFFIGDPRRGELTLTAPPTVLP